MEVCLSHGVFVIVVVCFFFFFERIEAVVITLRYIR